jgi:hypothetical protein
MKMIEKGANVHVCGFFEEDNAPRQRCFPNRCYELGGISMAIGLLSDDYRALICV